MYEDRNRNLTYGQIGNKYKVEYRSVAARIKRYQSKLNENVSTLG